MVIIILDHGIVFPKFYKKNNRKVKNKLNKCNSEFSYLTNSNGKVRAFFSGNNNSDLSIQLYIFNGQYLDQKIILIDNYKIKQTSQNPM